MKAESLLEAMGFVDGDLVMQAREPGKSRRRKRRWLVGSLAACLALALVIPAIIVINGVLPQGNISSDTGSGGEDPIGTAGQIERDYRIYYVDGGALSSVSLRLKAVPQERFNAWKDANDIGDEVEFIEENTREDSYLLTVSDSLRAYYDEDNGNDLLLQSLGKTMTEPEETYTGFELYLEGRAVYPDDYPEFVDRYDEQGRLIYSLRPWSDWSIEITEYDYEQGICKLSYYCPGGEIEPGVTTEPDYVLSYVEEVHIDETGEPVGWYTRHSYNPDGSLDSISEYDENHTERLYTGYFADGSIRAIVEYNAQSGMTKGLYYHEDGSFEEHHEVEYDEEGRDCKHIYYDAEGGILYYELYFFDENGNWAGEEYYNCFDLLVYFTECTYDERGRRLTERRYRGDGSLEKVTEYQYGNGMYYTSYSEYYYDEDGNLTSEWHGGELDSFIAGLVEDDWYEDDDG